MSNPEARTILVLVNGAVKDGERLIPPCSFEILVRHTFPARVEEACITIESFRMLHHIVLVPLASMHHIRRQKHNELFNI